MDRTTDRTASSAFAPLARVLSFLNNAEPATAAQTVSAFIIDVYATGRPFSDGAAYLRFVADSINAIMGADNERERFADVSLRALHDVRNYILSGALHTGRALAAV